MRIYRSPCLGGRKTASSCLASASPTVDSNKLEFGCGYFRLVFLLSFVLESHDDHNCGHRFPLGERWEGMFKSPA